MPCVDRRHAAFLYRFGRSSILVDCGEPLDASYKASGLSYDAIDGIVISHLHADHVGGLFMLVQGFWLEGRRKPLPIYLPARGIHPVREMLGAIFRGHKLSFPLQFAPLREGRRLVLGDLAITGFRTSHLPRRGADDGAYCFLLEGKGRRVGHSADLGRPEDLRPLLQHPLDLLVCEVAHFSPRRIFAYLGGKEVRRAVFVHLGRPAWNRLSQTRRLAAALLPALPHVFARDFQQIRF